MSWHFTSEPETFRAVAGAFLEADPVRNALVLTLADGARQLGWWTGRDGAVTGVLAESPPGAVSLGALPVEAARALAPALPDGAGLRELRGETAAVEAYTTAHEKTHGKTHGKPRTPGETPAPAPGLLTRTRLFRLGELVPPDPAPPGRARPATEADLPLLRDWTTDFVRDIGEEPAADHTGPLTERITEGRLHLWEAPDGRPVSMAARSRTTGGQTRVHLVYTPPADRGRGHAAGVTASITRAALASGAPQVVLFTDLANPTSNALYRRLGYRPVTDHLGVRFTGPAPRP
ncbi:GNAT family N-acetyltransferase [Streptomyces filamentosus]|uniref:N-acetyltransferase n=1 Tax=Streptomyces filamentosus TaxID=67294 RepID=A0A919EQJ6_STRFL|nr:GNAT family N-acetyltransferase [Streptomyces filamentosus]GHG16096.1 N-acetyltransferase [Streptomyces filamentosus]